MSELRKRIADLSPEKRALLVERLKRKQGTGLGIGKRPDPQTYPLSFAQQRMWFLHQMEPDSPLYNIPAAVRLTGDLNVPALQRSLQEIVRRHETLRATFVAKMGHVMQCIQDKVEVPLPVVDLRDLPQAEREAAWQRMAAEDARQPFDLTRDLLLRVRLLRLGEREYIVLLTMYHIASDGWSVAVLVRELAALYDAYAAGRASPLPDPPIQYADFAHWQREWLQGGVLTRQLDYWRKQLADAPSMLELPTDWPRPAVLTYNGAHYAFEIPKTLSDGVQALSRREGATLFMTLLAAFQALLYRYTRQEDICVGTPVANRNRGEIEGLIGCFVNTLVMRGDLSGAPTFRQLLARTRETALEAYAHQDVPFEMLVDELQPARTLSYTPLFQALFALEETPMDRLSLPGMTLDLLDVETGTAKFDLTLFVEQGAGGSLKGIFEYNTDLCEEATIERMARHFLRLLEGIIANPDQQVSRLPLLAEAERRQLLDEWAVVTSPYPRDATVHDLFAEQAARTPDAVALLFGDEEYTYAEVNRRANQLAHHLQALGVGPDVLVGLIMERSVEMVVAHLAILKAGGAYLPLGPDLPQERLAFTLQDGGVSILLTQPHLAEQLSASRLSALPGAVICLDGDWQRFAGESAENPTSGATADSLAYVMYTSGSTGRPKGVGVLHRGVVRLVKGTDYVDLGPDVVFPQYAPISFDAATLEIWGPLLNGGRLAVLPPHQLSLAEIGEGLRRYGVTHVWLTTSLFQLLVDERLEDLKHVKHIITGGDVASPTHFKRVLEKLDGVLLTNGYGPTENSTLSTSYTVTNWGQIRRTVPIGRPLANSSVYILDEHMQPTPIGVPGEIYVGGDGLARGYINRPELTAERFVANPFAQDARERLYKTGDLGRYLPDGNIEFLGRVDFQVKLRGFRIELGEIQAVLGQYPGLRDVVVLAREDTPGDKRLVAYLLVDGEAPETSDLRGYLRERLPEYMVPSAFVVMDTFPMTSSGKVDRKALPAPEWSRDSLGQEYVAPRTPVEQFLAEKWQEVLGVERVGIHDNFFELGGDSLQAAMLINKMQEDLNVNTHVRTIFMAPTIAEMAPYMIEYYPDAVAKIGQTANGTTLQETIELTIVDDESGLAAGSSIVNADSIAHIRRLVKTLPPRDEQTDAVGRKNPPAIFILSPPRSGSTLLRTMLAGHAGLFAPPEMDLLSFNTLDERRAAFSGENSFWLQGAIRAVMEARGIEVEEARRLMEAYEAQKLSTREFCRRLQEWIAPRVLVDKTPVYALDVEILRRMESDFREARYIHLVRHPYASVYSFIEAKLDQIFFRYAHPFSRRALAELVWIISHQNILAFLQSVPAERQHRIAFEQLVRDPEGSMRELCQFLGIEFHSCLVQPYDGKRMTDGIQDGVQMVGDFKFYLRDKIDPEVADRWKRFHTTDFLSDIGWDLAESLGYQRSTVDAQATREAASSQEWRLRPVSRQSLGELPLSFAQQRLWFLDQFEPGNSFYNIPSAVRMTGALDVQALEQSINEIIQRHEVLRTTFSAVDGRATQTIAPSLSVTIPVTDLRGLSDAAGQEGAVSRAKRDALVQQLAQDEARRPFDLSRGPLLRVRLLRLDEQEHVLLLTMHHIVSDGWSTGVLIRELAAFYQAFVESKPASLPPLPIQYADYAYWQREWLRGDSLQSELAYWKERLRGCPEHLELPTDRPRPAVRTLRGATHWFELPGALAQGVVRLARKERASLFMTLLAAFQTLLYRYTGQDDICVGTPVANRNRPEIEPLIGFFVNTLVLRGDLSGNPTFRQLLRRVRQVALGAYAHQDVPFEMLVDELSVARDMSRTPLFQVMFTVQDAPMESLRIPGLTLSPLATDSGAAKFDLILTVVKKRTALRASLEYNTDLFDAATIERMAGHFRALVEGIVATPDAPIAALPLLTADERAQLLYAWNATEAEYAHTQTIPALFARQAARTPDAVAVVYQGESLTYGELNRRANQLAHHLQTLGVGPEVLVGLCVERSVDMLVGLMGILKAGGAYVPLDPSYPPERLAYMLTDASVPVLLTQGRLLAQLPTFAGETVCLDRDWAAIARQPEQEPDSLVGPENLAYVIYTSGSTGKPKGTMVSHRSALNLAAALREQIYTHLPRRPLRVSLNAPLSFDASAQEWLMLLYGDALHVIPQDMRLDGDALVRYVREQQLDVLDCVPSQLKLLLGAGLLAEGEWVPGAVLPGGEAIDPATWAVLRQAPSTEFYNMYGPTECTVDSTIGWVRACGERPSIGKPVSNARLYVLDGQGEPVPVGVPGELYIGGAGVSRGYLQRPELTAERFVPDPFSGEPGARLYRTGDRVRYLPDGNVEFLGRLDDQVKLRGYRIELGEIEAVLREQAGIRDAVVLVREDQPGHQRLVAYVVPEGQPPSIAELRAQLGHTLPEYMVPSTYVFLEAFPLTPNAKVDRRALPAPEAARPDLESDYVAPRTPEEQIMAGIWAQVLGVEQVGVYDNFFELGGDSILSIQVVARANQAGLRISPRQVFQYPTVAALAAVAGKGPQVQAEQGVVTGAVPLTPIQRHFFAQNLPNPHHWNQAVLLEVREALDPDLLRRTVQHLMAHHDALRLRFHRTAEGWQQTNADLDGRVPFSLVDLSGVPEGEQQAAIEREATRLQSSLHLTEGPLWQVAYMRLGDGRPGRLLLVAHHLTIDGVSWRVLFEDLQTVYRQLQQGQPLALPLKTTSFRQWASRLEEYARRDALREQLRYWQSLGEGVYPLPVDWPEGANTEASAEWVRGGLTEDETVALLRDVPAAYGTEINDALLTALAQAFRERTGVPSLLVDLEGHGRESLFDDVDLSRTVGWFTALYPVRLDLGMIEHPGEALKAIKEQLRGIPQRGLGYGLLRYLGDDRAALQALPQAQVSFNYLGQFELGLNDALLAPARESAGPERDPAATRAYLLDISASVRGGRLQVDWLYSRNQYRRETIEALAEGYLRALRELVAHCQSPEAGGYTASDFPEASLDQQELDEILLELKEASGDE